MKKVTWGFLGCGKMAQAIVRGALDQKLLPPSRIVIVNRTPEKSKGFSKSTGVRAVFDMESLIERAGVIVIGTKPQDILPVLEAVSRSGDKDKIVISLAAGVSSVTLKKYLGRFRTVARVMGNTPVMVQKGLFGISFIKSEPRDRRQIAEFFSQLGRTVIVRDDRDINALTASSASGTGFVLKLMEEFESWLARRGFTGEQARQVALETFAGAAALAGAENHKKLSQLREDITSKKGTTLAGLNALRVAKVPAGLRSALDAAYQRSVEISKSLLKNQK